MEYINLGNSGLKVSRICLGCMGFGDPDIWIHDWIVKEKESRKIIKEALDLGINFFDTANVYSFGESERILGQAINDYANREEVVIATKVSVAMSERPNKGGLSRKAIFQEVNNSLERLKTDYIDLLVVHRWDYDTPIEETMKALHDLVESKKVLYIGASSMYAWQFQKANNIAKKNNWTPFISMQSHYNLLYREEEREMIPYCHDQGISLTPYSPLAAGRLTRKWSSESQRYQSDKVARQKYDSTQDLDMKIVNQVHDLSEKYNVSQAQIALAWLLSKDYVTSPIIGTTKISHLRDAVLALEVTLEREDIELLEKYYQPHNIVGHI